MAASSSGALKAKIESLGLGISAYRDSAPDGTPLVPAYATIREGVAGVPDGLEDGVLTTGVEHIQVDLWQQYRDPTTKALTESYTLPSAVMAGLHGASLVNIGTKRAYVALVMNLIRMPAEEEENVIHHVIDLDLWREL